MLFRAAWVSGGIRRASGAAGVRKASSKLGYCISSFEQVSWQRDDASLLGQMRVPGNYITASAPACSKSF